METIKIGRREYTGTLSKIEFDTDFSSLKSASLASRKNLKTLASLSDRRAALRVWPTPHRPPQANSAQLFFQFRRLRTLRVKVEKVDGNGNNSGGVGGSGEKQSHRLPLSDVVSDCLRRWLQDTLKEAKAGDLSMQVLVAQMYFNGYGIPKDAQKVRFDLHGFFTAVYSFFFESRKLSA
ncbi:hypothetical protein LXL04_009062 [Taraxacum kok-saghyz]